ncbi:hypothetical protein Bbelb_116720 [Branchiostoma belcheri]|nr:hypothetical protein Bbelb_116720 [Branchiostoma belcheri]
MCPGSGGSDFSGAGQRSPGSRKGGPRTTHGAVHGHFLPCTGMYRDRVRAYNVQYTTCTQKVVHFRECTGHVRDWTRFVCRSETPGFYRKPKISGKVCGNFSHGNGGFCAVALTCTQSARLERQQKRACRIILGTQFTDYASALSTLNLDPFAKKLLNSEFSDWLPPSRKQISGRNTRSANKLDTPICRTTRHKNSAIPYMTNLLNKHFN